MSDPALAATPLSSQSFVFKPGALAPDAAYAFAITATDFSGTGSAQVSFRTAPAPQLAQGARGVVVAAQNVTAEGLAFGTAYASPFTISALGWAGGGGGAGGNGGGGNGGNGALSPLLRAAQLPASASLEYQISYFIEGQAKDPIVLLPFQPVSNMRTTLPPGNASFGFRVNVQLCVSLLLCTQHPSPYHLPAKNPPRYFFFTHR